MKTQLIVEADHAYIVAHAENEFEKKVLDDLHRFDETSASISTDQSYGHVHKATLQVRFSTKPKQLYK